MGDSSIYKFNPKAAYETNGGQNQQILTGEDLYKQTIVVSENINTFEDAKVFPAVFPNIFVNYPLGGMRTTDKKWANWQHNPMRLWQTQLNFATWCATSACGISSQHLTNEKHLLVMSLYLFHVYYHIRRIIKQMEIPLPFEKSYHQFDNPYSPEEFLKVCNEYRVDPDPQKYKGEYFFSSYQRSAPDIPRPGLSQFNKDSMTRWIIEKSRGFTKTGLFMISESVRAYVYLILSSQASARSTIIGEDSSALTAQRVFMNNFEDIVNRRVDIQEDIKRYQDTLNYASSKVDYSVGQDIYMLPSNMDLNIKSGVKGYNNKILISGTGLNLGINGKVNSKEVTHHDFDKQVTHHKTVVHQKTKTPAKSVDHDEETKTLTKSVDHDGETKTPTKSVGHDENITLEEEKIGLILLLTAGFTIFYHFLL